MLVLLGGVIASAADRLGRRLGKKRLSVFGLRPRHTAEVLTVGAGILIPLITITVLYVGSQDVRDWINKGRQAIVDLQKTQGELTAARTERERLSRENSTIQANNVRLQGENQRAAEQIRIAGVRIGTIQAKVADLQRRRTNLEGRIAEFQRRVAALGGRVTRLGGQLDQTRAALRFSSNTLKTTDARRQEVKRSFDELQSQYKDLTEYNIGLLDQNRQLETARSELQRSRDSLAGEKTRLEQEISERQERLTMTETRLTDAQTRLDVTEDQLARADRAFANLMALTRAMGETVVDTRTQPVVYHFGEEMARLALEPNLSEAQARNALATLIRTTRVLAAERGAKARGSVPVAGFFGRTDRDTQMAVRPEEIEQGIVDRIRNRPEAQVLITYASVNVFQGEPVPVDATVLPNPVVFRTREVLAEARVNGGADVIDILRQVSELVKAVADRALAEKMVPRAGSLHPFGPFDQEELVRTVMEIRQANRPIRLQAVAVEDLRAGDPLRVELRIR